MGWIRILFRGRKSEKAESEKVKTERVILRKEGYKEVKESKKSFLQQEAEDIEKYTDFLNDFGDNVEQKRGVVSESKRILVLAGAGSGKTKVLTKRIVHLVKNKKVPIEKILAITFTSASAEEMRNRVGAMLEIKADNLRRNIRTFHSFCLSILKQNEQFDVLNEKDQRELVQKIVYSLKDNEEVMTSLYDYIQEALIDKIKEKDNENSRNP